MRDFKTPDFAGEPVRFIIDGSGLGVVLLIGFTLLAIAMILREGR